MARASILLVDDLPENLLVLEAVLADVDADLIRANSGEDALKRVLEQDFAVILLDVQMPGMDGFETAALIRQRAKSQHTPIIFVTALHSSEDNVFRGYDLGAVDYIVKPLRPKIMRSKVNVFVELFQAVEQVKDQAEQLRQQELGEMKMRLEEEALAQRLDTLRVSQRFFQAALDALPLAVAILDDAGAIVAVNDAWGMTEAREEFFGPDHAVGTNYLQALEMAGEEQAEQAAMARAIRAATVQQSFSFYLEFKIDDAGDQRWYIGRLTRFLHQDQVRVMVIYEDVSRLKGQPAHKS